MTRTDAGIAVQSITLQDIGEIIAAGWRDFLAAPLYGLAFAGLFAAAGWLLIALLFALNLPYLAYPLAMGFALVAPFAAAGFYAVSDHLERGAALTWGGVMAGVGAAIRRDLRWMAFVTGFALVIWMDIAAFVFFAFTGFHGVTPAFFRELFTTPSGLSFLAVGNLIGAAIAFTIFSISAVSFPLLYDRDVDFVTAMTTSVRFVRRNLAPMLLWCALIGLAMSASVMTGFLGLFLAMPVIGHATWRLYRRALV